jgi:hypothetical protein
VRRLAPALAALALLAAGSVFAADAVKGGLAPAVEPAAQGERCVEDTATMRRNHMRFLEHQRDDTVKGGVRGARHSLKGCIGCHASKTTGSVAAAKTDFCVACHSYAAVKVDCFECHSTRPANAVAAAGPKP